MDEHTHRAGNFKDLVCSLLLEEIKLYPREREGERGSLSLNVSRSLTVHMWSV